MNADEIKALARGAKGLLGEPTFNQAVLDLRQQWFGELMTVDEHYDRRLELVAKLRALEEIPTQLKSYITSEMMLIKAKSNVRR